MSLPEVVSREEWTRRRRELLVEEKALTRARDRLNAARRRLPMVPVTKPYTFHGPEGEVTLLDLFDGCRQLVVQHFMFDPRWDEGCPACTAAVEERSQGLLDHLRSRDTTMAVVSRAPLEKLERYKSRQGWTFPWYSSSGSDFNYDFHVTIDAGVAPVEFNYRTAEELAETGFGWMLDPANQPSEQPGLSFFLRDGDQIFHTYSTFARGTEALGGSYAVLDLTALGRQEEWEEPQGRAVAPRPNVPAF